MNGDGVNFDGAPQISIALATFNGEKFLREQLESYLKQTFPPAELVVTDDSSSDGTRTLIEEFAAVAPFPVRLFRNETRLGFRDNFLKAASLCTSQYIAYSDQDDVWLPSKLAKCAAALDGNDTVMAIHGAYVVDEFLNVEGRLKQGFTSDAIREPLSIRPVPGMGFGFTMVFEKRLLQLVDCDKRPACPAARVGRDELETPRRKVAHDLWTYLLASVFGNVVQIAEPLALYRQHGSNAYGFGGSSTSCAFMQYLRVPLRLFKARHQFALSWAVVLKEAAPTLGSDDRIRAELGSEYYWQIARGLGARVDLYESDSILRRVTLYYNLWRTGTYRALLGRGAGLRDLVSGVAGLRLAKEE